MTQANDNKPGEGTVPAIDLSKYVPKEEHEKTLNDSKTSVEKLQKELDNAKLSLLDPDYIAYLENKKSSGDKKLSAAKDKLEDDDLTKAEIKELRENISRLASGQQQIAAVLELNEVRNKYDDFDEYRGKTKEILDTSTTPLSIEQAYLQAKGQVVTEKTQEEKAAAAKAASEKPSGTVPGQTLEPKAFKSKSEAAEDAWNRSVGAGKDIL